MLDHILIPLDGSLLAEEALAPAKQILHPQGKVILVSVVETLTHWEFGIAPEVMLGQSEDMTQQLMPRARGYLEQVAEDLRAEGFHVDTLILYGDAATIIVETASARKVDAIAMSTHGRSGFGRWLFGSVTNKVLSAAPCPVFVIPSKHPRPQLEELTREVKYQ
ncbi:MAG: universal stress protein [Chloroflexota bacterium]